jgi:hypothetical protein
MVQRAMKMQSSSKFAGGNVATIVEKPQTDAEWALGLARKYEARGEDVFEAKRLILNAAFEADLGKKGVAEMVDGSATLKDLRRNINIWLDGSLMWKEHKREGAGITFSDPELKVLRKVFKVGDEDIETLGHGDNEKTADWIYTKLCRLSTYLRPVRYFENANDIIEMLCERWGLNGEMPTSFTRFSETHDYGDAKARTMIILAVGLVETANKIMMKEARK